jgi:hypothetical protein
MRDFIDKVKTEAYKRGGNIYQFFSSCIRRAENFMKSGWTVYIEKAQTMDSATFVEVYLTLWKFSDATSKRDRYRAKEDQIISEINYLLNHEGIKDWTIQKAENWFFGTGIVYFTATRPKPTLTLGKTSLWETVQLVGQVLCLKGFYITDVIIKKDGIMIYQAWQDNPTTSEIYEIENLMSFYERENAIDDVVEETIEKIAEAEQEKAKEGGTIGEIESFLKTILIIAIIFVIIYLIDKTVNIGEKFKGLLKK